MIYPDSLQGKENGAKDWIQEKLLQKMLTQGPWGIQKISYSSAWTIFP